MVYLAWLASLCGVGWLDGIPQGLAEIYTWEYLKYTSESFFLDPDTYNDLISVDDAFELIAARRRRIFEDKVSRTVIRAAISAFSSPDSPHGLRLSFLMDQVYCICL